MTHLYDRLAAFAWWWRQRAYRRAVHAEWRAARAAENGQRPPLVSGNRWALYACLARKGRGA